jgi:hypothetical protein
LPAIEGLDYATIIYNVLAQCSDQYPPRTTTELSFITDPDLRENIRRDIGAIDRSIANAEWKAANVLAGAAIEALLHWRLGLEPPTSAQIGSAVATLVNNSGMKDPKTLDRDR